jgi:hypothetical protein
LLIAYLGPEQITAPGVTLPEMAVFDRVPQGEATAPQVVRDWISAQWCRERRHTEINASA